MTFAPVEELNLIQRLAAEAFDGNVV